MRINRERLDRYFLRGCFTDADIEADPGTGGSKFRVDDDGTRVWPYTKLVWGGSGVQTELSAGAAALPIQDGGNSITVDGSVTVTQGTGTNLHVVIDSGAITLPSGAATAAKQDSQTTLLAGGLPAALGAGGGIKIDGSGTALPVSLASVPSHAVTNAGVFAVQVDGSALTSLQLLDDTIIADDAAFTAGTTKVAMAGFVADESSTDSVNEDDAGAARMTLDRKQIVSTYAHTTGGWTPHSHISDGTNQDAEVVKGSAGQLGWVNATNINAAPAYVKFYNSAATSEETDTPVLRFLVPGNTAGAGVALAMPPGTAFSSGICYRITTAVADASSAGAAANEVLLNLGFA